MANWLGEPAGRPRANADNADNALEEVAARIRALFRG
jgi:hypothetical protein